MSDEDAMTQFDVEIEDQDRFDPTAYDALLESWRQDQVTIKTLTMALDAKIKALSPKEGDVLALNFGGVLTAKESNHLTSCVTSVLAACGVILPVIVLHDNQTAELRQEAPPLLEIE